MRLACLRSVALLGLAGGLAAQEEPTIHVDVRLVRILATVKDTAGSLVGALEKSDFEVRDNGAPQPVAVFERQTDQPLSVGILIDNSGSTAKDLKYETDSVIRFIRALLREGNPADSVGLYSFNFQVVKQNGFTRNTAAIERSLKALRGEAGTSLYDAILLGSRDIEDRDGRKILIVVTDGGDTTSHADFQRAVEAAQLADAVIYPVLVVPITNDAGRNTGGENALTTMALRTGGRVFQPSLGAEMDKAFDQIIRDLRTQYLLGFYPRDVPLTKDRFHSLQVTVRDPALRVIARSGYYGEALRGSSPPASGPITVGPGDETLRTKKPQPATKSSKTGKVYQD
ncbi:MAG: VWA domain-containing protein [Acidobacteriota bacterium]